MKRNCVEEDTAMHLPNSFLSSWVYFVWRSIAVNQVSRPLLATMLADDVRCTFTQPQELDIEKEMTRKVN